MVVAATVSRVQAPLTGRAEIPRDLAATPATDIRRAERRLVELEARLAQTP